MLTYRTIEERRDHSKHLDDTNQVSFFSLFLISRCVLMAFNNSRRLTYVTSFYRSIKVNQSAGCQYCSCLRRKIGRFMLPHLYTLPLTTLWKSYLFVADDIKFFNPHNVHVEGILLCVISAFPRCSFDSMSFC